MTNPLEWRYAVKKFDNTKFIAPEQWQQLEKALVLNGQEKIQLLNQLDMNKHLQDSMAQVNEKVKSVAEKHRLRQAAIN